MYWYTRLAWADADFAAGWLREQLLSQKAPACVLQELRQSSACRRWCCPLGSDLFWSACAVEAWSHSHWDQCVWVPKLYFLSRDVHRCSFSLAACLCQIEECHMLRLAACFCAVLCCSIPRFRLRKHSLKSCNSATWCHAYMWGYR